MPNGETPQVTIYCKCGVMLGVSGEMFAVGVIDEAGEWRPTVKLGANEKPVTIQCAKCDEVRVWRPSPGRSFISACKLSA